MTSLEEEQNDNTNFLRLVYTVYATGPWLESDHI